MVNERILFIKIITLDGSEAFSLDWLFIHLTVVRVHVLIFLKASLSL